MIFTTSVLAQRQRTISNPSPGPAVVVKPVEQNTQSDLVRSMAELSRQISNGLTENQKRTIAVMEFVNLKGTVTDFGRFIAEELITHLYQTGKFKVIERQLLNQVITEQKLSLTGIIDQTSAQRLGKLLGVDAIASGTVTDLGKSLRVNARLINTGTGEIFAVASTEIFKDESVMGLLSGMSSAPKDGRPTPQQADTAKKNPRKIMVRDFILELQSCRASAGSVLCSLTITNDISSDRVIEFETTYQPLSRMFDEFGGEYVGKKTQISGSMTQDYAGSTVSNSLVPQVPMKLRITFDNVNPDAKTITLLRVAFKWVSGKDNYGNINSVNINADFKDLPITK
jgi:TolB-like protein